MDVAEEETRRQRKAGLVMGIEPQGAVKRPGYDGSRVVDGGAEPAGAARQEA